MARNFGYARLVRINDHRTRSYQDGLDSCSWHYDNGKQLAQREPMGLLRSTSWPYKGFRIVAAGCHGGKGLVMFGVCQSTQWAPYSDPNDIYHSQIDVAWENGIFWIDVGSEPTVLPRSNAPLTKAEYLAWRTQATLLMDAEQNPVAS
jgi:hypothetical protein